ncbi:hypothetical protein SERLA73DRAFT_161018 [Serpula lacrymans var. lacrymans S7.3]|uniref:Uncharacterized protein n=1 Tax=Serpula lacrymans var. lacrymans (strain S7.3) TaxID=936435 RepID=F8Q1B2_SERL3|nr:hypothetical protein SERLA73DRAFT_161018 [Serpula lacrymans var. lacrymans S7.3]
MCSQWRRKNLPKCRNAESTEWKSKGESLLIEDDPETPMAKTKGPGIPNFMLLGLLQLGLLHGTPISKILFVRVSARERFEERPREGTEEGSGEHDFHVSWLFLTAITQFERVKNEGRAVDPLLITRDDEAVEELVWFEPGRQTAKRRETLDNRWWLQMVPPWPCTFATMPIQPARSKSPPAPTTGKQKCDVAHMLGVLLKKVKRAAPSRCSPSLPLFLGLKGHLTPHTPALALGLLVPGEQVPEVSSHLLRAIRDWKLESNIKETPHLSELCAGVTNSWLLYTYLKSNIEKGMKILSIIAESFLSLLWAVDLVKFVLVYSYLLVETIGNISCYWCKSKIFLQK